MNDEQLYEVGDLVQFLLDDQEAYSYEVPKFGSYGIVQLQSHSNGLEQMLGVKIPMTIVQFDGGIKLAIFNHDITKAVLSEEDIDEISTRIRTYSGLDKN